MLNEIPPPELITYYGLDPDTNHEPLLYFDQAFNYGDYKDGDRLELVFRKYPGLLEQRPITRFLRGWKEKQVELTQVKRLFDILNSEEMNEMPVEILIEISADGTVQVEGLRFGVEDKMLDDLVVQLQGLKQIAQSQKSPFSVNLLPNGEAIQDRVIDVMDACAAAGVKNLSFSKSI